MPNLIHTERRSALNAQSEVVNQRGDGLERGTPTPTCHTTRQLLVLSISIYVAKNTFRQLSARSPPHTRNSVAPSALSLPFLFPLSSFPSSSSPTGFFHMRHLTPNTTTPRLLVHDENAVIGRI